MLLICSAGAAEVPPPLQTLGDLRTLQGWNGLEIRNGQAVLSIGGEAVFAYPAGPRGWYQRGLRREFDGAGDWRGYWGLVIDLDLASDGPVELTAAIDIPNQPVRVEYVPQTTAKVLLKGSGAHRVVIPWSSFDFQQVQPAFLKFVSELHLSVHSVEGANAGDVILRDVRITRGPMLAMDSEVRGKSAPGGEAVEYPVTISNCTDQPESVELSFRKYGWETMDATVAPSHLQLAPGASGDVVVRVEVPEQIPASGHEKQVLEAITNGAANSAATITFITAARLPHPYILHTPLAWQVVRNNVAHYDWARAARQQYVKEAEKWSVPQVPKPPKNLTGLDDFGPFVFVSSEAKTAMDCGIAWELTGNKTYAEKVRTFLLRISDPTDGYPVTLRGCNQSLVQEGECFQHIARAYDMALDSGLFTDADQAQIARTFRLFIDTIELETDMGAINNWNLAQITGALYCSLAMQDLSLADRFFAGRGGITDQLGKGVLDDGWWYECAISYNVWCASEFTQVALAMEPWGVNFKLMEVPVSYSPHPSLRPFDYLKPQFGVTSDKWGPITHSTMNIKLMWDALPKFTDYRGIMFGVNDATERRVGGAPYDLAYYVYRDPNYVTSILQGGDRDLLYAVPDLPAHPTELFHDSAVADNSGLICLRSQTEDRPISDQIQAALHYGSHGGYHGHFDRTDMLCLMRYGRSFYNPEMIWYGYASFLYKFYVQTSVSHNMVVVDRKMQEAVPGKRLLFYSGKMMQAGVVETDARWSNPPYGGMVYREQGFKSLAPKIFSEGRSIPVPPDAPAYGALTGFTEPILQRRLMLVTDDYVLLADYLKSEHPHDFDNLLQIKGLLGIDAAGKKLIRHDAQWTDDPLSSAQFITDCDWYSAVAPVVTHFVTHYGPDAVDPDSRSIFNTPGDLKLDVHSLWPAHQQIMIGTAPEQQPVEKKTRFTVRGDARTLASGESGTWILGQVNVDVKLDGVQQLELQTTTEDSHKPSLFWGNARVVTRSGQEIPLSALPATFENVTQPKSTGQDYFGGPVKIAGMLCNQSTPAEPLNEAKPALVHVNLAGIDAVRFESVLGSDFPLGDESQQRKTFAVHAAGTEASFLTLIEPYDGKPVVKAAQAADAGTLTVELADGRTQNISISNLSGGGRIGVTISETRDGKQLRSESAVGD